MFKQLNKKGYKHYYEGTVEELDSMDKDNQHLYSEIMQVIMWLYEKHGIWITVCVIGADGFGYWLHDRNRKRLNPDNQGGYWLSPTEAYEAAIKYVLENLILKK